MMAGPEWAMLIVGLITGFGLGAVLFTLKEINVD
jgi:hypothetical protein